jgi:hypothetical protein
MKLISLKNKASKITAVSVTLRLILLFSLITVINLAFLGSPVQAAPVITPAILPQGQVGVPYSVTLTASSLVPPVIWAITAGGLPMGISLSPSTGIISGVPIFASNYAFNVQVTDNTSVPSNQQGFSITIIPPPVTINTADLPDGLTGSPYNAFISTTGGRTPYTWSLVAGRLPPGLTLNHEAGYISGVPEFGTGGYYYFSIRVVDSSSFQMTDQRAFIIFIERATYQATIQVDSSLSAGSARVNIDGRQVIALKGGESYTFTIDLGFNKTVTVDSMVPHPTDSGVRFRAKVESFTISTAQSSIIVSYYTEYKIDVGMAPSLNISPTGAGWYKKDETISLSTSSVLPGSTNTEYRFSNWLLPDGNKITTEILRYVVITPSIITAIYDTYYKLSIQVVPPQITAPTGAGWYKKDTTISLSSRPVLPGDANTEYRFSNWLLPDGNKITTEMLSHIITSPSIITSLYDTYYKLTTQSIYGQVEGAGWYKAGTGAAWAVTATEVPMQGIIGFFQGKYKPVNPNGTEIMESPRTVTISWEPDYTLPYIFIPSAIILIILIIVGLYFLFRRPKPKLVPYPASQIPLQALPQSLSPRPVPQQHTTVVMIGDKGGNKQLPYTTREQLIEKFAQLLDTYEADIKSTLGKNERAKFKSLKDKMSLTTGAGTNIAETEFIKKLSEAGTCEVTTKRLLRTVAGNWRQVESSIVNLALTDENSSEHTGLSVIWGRDIFHEWKIINCKLPINHTGNHKGDISVVYSLLNTITVKQTYTEDQPVQPPSPHFTDSMPEVEPDEDNILATEELPAQTI